MAAITAIEFDGDTCAIARTTVRRGEVTVSAAELLSTTSFPGTDAFVTGLRKCRRTLGLPRRTRVVLWGLPDGATPRDPGAVAALAPLTAAGFKVDRVVTPCNALGALSRLRAPRGEGATCWVAVNTAGVALVVIRPGHQLYSRSFGWDSNVGATGSQARLLQRYSLVAFLAPEIRRAMAAATALGSQVRAVVTCGNLPDLRALTMPLIEELDMEVETLDSLDGLQLNADAPARLTELAAAIRLASAGVVARRTRPWDDSKRVAALRTKALVRAALIAGMLAGLGAAYMLFDWWRTHGAADARDAAPAAASAAPPAATSGRTAPDPTDTSAPRAEPKPAPVRSAPPPVRSTPPVRSAPAPSAPPAARAAPPAVRPDPPPARTETPATKPATTLADPLPRVTAILISYDRRFATIADGRVVGVGDSIGRRVVVAIQERSVTLREPSGSEVQVRLGGGS